MSPLLITELLDSRYIHVDVMVCDYIMNIVERIYAYVCYLSLSLSLSLIVGCSAPV